MRMALIKNTVLSQREYEPMRVIAKQLELEEKTENTPKISKTQNNCGIGGSCI